MHTAPLSPRLTPSGHLLAVPDALGPALDQTVASGLSAAFARGAGHGLLYLAGVQVGAALPAVWAWWRDLGVRYINGVCTRPEPDGAWTALPPPAPETLLELAENPPPMLGAEYLSAPALAALWGELDAVFSARLAEGVSLTELLKALNPAWNLVGRVHFNLAENRRDEDAPFAFLATYTTRLSATGKAQHKALGQALREYADAADKGQLLALLTPVQRAAEAAPWLRAMIDSGEIFHPIRWSPVEASRFLTDVPLLEAAGVIVRMPAAWRSGRPARPRVTTTVGASAPSTLGQGALLDFKVELALHGEALSEEEIEQILASTAGLALIRGQWVEVDAARLDRTLARLKEAQRLADARGLSFAEAMRLVSGAGIQEGELAETADPEWAAAVAGPWLAATLAALRAPGGQGVDEAALGLKGTLRPYQRAGVQWLQLVTGLGLGACLADDMGLGKTIQVLGLLLSRRPASAPSLLVAPASLLGNWVAEAAVFAPDLRVLVAHASAMPAVRLKALDAAALSGFDLVVLTYASLSRLPWVSQMAWDLIVMDEAQALKNPSAGQTRAARKLKARARVALTGTPVENRLGDLWSIFDVVNPGLLGSARQFHRYTKRLSARASNPYGPLRALVSPYILRRLKTDRSVIRDLPDKTELNAYCGLSRLQASLYQRATTELAEALRSADGMKRRGLVLAFLTRFKQICNHPSQWLGDGGWAPADSGKWARLTEIGEVIAARQEKVLVFTQFAGIIPALAEHLGQIFGRPGLTLHGDTPIGERKERVARFQEDELTPFMVLSLKAGGSGLNLTAASHVIHFDRWWNPAVEDQATDRAFRIGQARNVLVHKFVCRGTIEENIDALIQSKKQLSQDLFEGGVDASITEMDDAALLELVRLDLDSALQE